MQKRAQICKQYHTTIGRGRKDRTLPQGRLKGVLMGLPTPRLMTLGGLIGLGEAYERLGRAGRKKGSKGASEEVRGKRQKTWN